MYITKNSGSADFDWNTYFSATKSEADNLEYKKIIFNIRNTLKEKPFHITFTLTNVMRTLLLESKLNNTISILELGAGTGFLTRWLLNEYNGIGELVDNNASSYEAFCKLDLSENLKSKINYIQDDLFVFKSDKKYDIVCSFGVVEHFKDKKNIIAAHKKFVKSEGYIIILVPMDSYLSRIYWEVFQELNLGYRELLTCNELQNILKCEGLEILKTSVSQGYCYDFIAVLAKLRDV